MAHKRVMFRSAARETIPPRGSAARRCDPSYVGAKVEIGLIQRKWGAPIVCNDGVTIAKEFDLSDFEESVWRQVLRQAAEKTGEIVGDGTSTSHAFLRMPFLRTEYATSSPGPVQSTSSVAWIVVSKPRSMR